MYHTTNAYDIRIIPCTDYMDTEHVPVDPSFSTAVRQQQGEEMNSSSSAVPSSRHADSRETMVQTEFRGAITRKICLLIPSIYLPPTIPRL